MRPGCLLFAGLIAGLALLPSRASAQSAPLTPDPSFLIGGMVQSSGQSRSGNGGPGFGVKGGFLFSSFTEAGQSFRNNNGWEAGIFFGGNRTGVIGLMGEILYAKKGSQNGAGTVTVDQYYLEIPVLLRVNIGSANRNTGFVVYAIGGPALDVLLKAQQNNFDVKSNYEGLDYGIILGGGIEISRFLVEGRVNLGLRNVLKPSSLLTGDVKSRSVALLGGIRFN